MTEWTAPDGRRYRHHPALQGWQAALMSFGLAKHGEMKLVHWKNYIRAVWPDPVFIWDEWCDLFFGALCGAEDTIRRITGKDHKFFPGWYRCTVFSGCSSSGKSTKAALWMLGNWIVEQEKTACILTSTSVDMLSKRIWADILTWVGQANCKFPMRSIPSELELRWNDEDRKHAVFGVAVKSGGNPQEAVDRIKGIHCDRIFVAIDEMTSVPPAIVTACRNLNKGTSEFQLIGLGNAISKTDPHGERCEPEEGWNSVTVEDKFWITRYGCAVHFDAYDSPAMKEPERYRFYPSKQALDEEAREKGGLNSPEAWSGIRGFWPPTGLTKTLMDEAFLEQFHARDAAVWEGIPINGAAFDGSWEGGDRSCLYPFKYGKFTNGKTGLEFGEPIVVAVDLTQGKQWLHYALADAVEGHCRRLKVDPENFVQDVTGEGGGFHAILSSRWSPKIHGVEFGGSADKTQVNTGRPTTWHETVVNRVTMIWMMLRSYIEGDQVRGLRDAETIKELTTRLREMKGSKVQVEPKKEMKKRGLRSPDFADAACLAAFLLYLKGIQPVGASAGMQEQSFDTWNKLCEKRQHEADYADSEASYA